MYKVFLGRKSVIITNESHEKKKKSTRIVGFVNAEKLHQEYKRFLGDKALLNLVVIGDAELIWKVFCSFFRMVKAAGGLVLNEKGRLLMIYRNHHWDLPKGKMEPGEVPAETAIREVNEECGIGGLKIKAEITPSYHLYMDNEKECMKKTYWYLMTTSDRSLPQPQEIEGILKAEWKRKFEVRRVWRWIYPSLHRVINEAFSGSL